MNLKNFLYIWDFFKYKFVLREKKKNNLRIIILNVKFPFDIPYIKINLKFKL